VKNTKLTLSLITKVTMISVKINLVINIICHLWQNSCVRKEGGMKTQAVKAPSNTTVTNKPGSHAVIIIILITTSPGSHVWFQCHSHNHGHNHSHKSFLMTSLWLWRHMNQVIYHYIMIHVQERCDLPSL